MLPTIRHYVNRRLTSGAHRLPPAGPTVHLPHMHIDDRPDPNQPTAPHLPHQRGWRYDSQLYDVRGQRLRLAMSYASRWLLLGAVVLFSIGFLKHGG